MGHGALVGHGVLLEPGVITLNRIFFAKSFTPYV